MTMPRLNYCGATSTTRWSGPRPTRRRMSSSDVGRATRRVMAACSTALLRGSEDVADAFVDTLTAPRGRRVLRRARPREGAMAFIGRRDGTFVDVVKGSSVAAVASLVS